MNKSITPLARLELDTKVLSFSSVWNLESIQCPLWSFYLEDFPLGCTLILKFNELSSHWLHENSDVNRYIKGKYSL